MPVLISRRVFNYDYQYFQAVDRKFQSGDSLKLNCIYDTRDTNVTLMGGRSTSEEMCLFYYLYFPKMADQVRNYIFTIQEALVGCDTRSVVDKSQFEGKTPAVDTRPTCQKSHADFKN